MDASQARSRSRIGRGLILGVVIGVVAGAAIGGIVGLLVWERTGPILASALFGAIGLGMLGAFWGGMTGLESPDPGHEPGERAEPLAETDLTSEERPLHQLDADGS
jgi:hypothetical protein